MRWYQLQAIASPARAQSAIREGKTAAIGPTPWATISASGIAPASAAVPLPPVDWASSRAISHPWRRTEDWMSCHPIPSHQPQKVSVTPASASAARARSRKGRGQRSTRTRKAPAAIVPPAMTVCSHHSLAGRHRDGEPDQGGPDPAPFLERPRPREEEQSRQRREGEHRRRQDQEEQQAQRGRHRSAWPADSHVGHGGQPPNPLM